MSDFVNYPMASSPNTKSKKNLFHLSPEDEDKLTHIYNRTGFLKKAQEMISSHEPGFYLLSCVNIDDFKAINEQYGVETGDLVLCNVAESFFKCLNGTGGICAHFSADNFAVLYPDAYRNAEQIFTGHARACTPECILQRIHIRIGRCVVTDLSVPVSSLYDHARLAADSIRHNFNKYIEYYTEDMREKLLKRQSIISDMADALRHEEFEVWFQPQYNHATGALIGAEALSRWKHGDSYISPKDFIPIFEETDFIYNLDLYVWEQCCKLLRRWTDEGRSPLPISVNVSRCDIVHPDFPRSLTDIISKYDIPVSMLHLEITESAIGGLSQIILNKIKSLIDNGFIIEIDDFGSGYSSLNSLKDVPASILKLDMKFFEETTDTDRAGSIIASVVRMAKWLDMAVIAEGVETKEQADYLKSIGCHYIQGFYYATPMSVNEYEKLAAIKPKEHELTRLHSLETFDNNKFWSSDSIDTLIFNSYVGGACIFEYCGKTVEILRTNDQYFAQFKGILSNDTKFTGHSLDKYITSEDKQKFYKALDKTIKTRTETGCSMRLSDGGHVEYLSLALRVLSRYDDRFLCYCSVHNITEQVEALIKEYGSQSAK